MDLHLGIMFVLFAAGCPGGDAMVNGLMGSFLPYPTSLVRKFDDDNDWKLEFVELLAYVKAAPNYKNFDSRVKSAGIKKVLKGAYTKYRSKVLAEVSKKSIKDYDSGKKDNKLNVAEFTTFWNAPVTDQYRLWLETVIAFFYMDTNGNKGIEKKEINDYLTNHIVQPSSRSATDSYASLFLNKYKSKDGKINFYEFTSLWKVMRMIIPDIEKKDK